MYVPKTAPIGFTLIEILVSVTLMMLMLGGGIAAYGRFGDRQKVVESASGVINIMRSAQIKARSGDSPTGCNKLVSYRVIITAGSPIVQLLAVCTSPDSTFSRSTYTMIAGTQPEGSAVLDFYVLKGGVSNSADVVIKSTTSLPVWRYQFSVTTGGSIDEGKFL